MKCALGPKKLQQLQRLIGDQYRVKKAFVRGGWDHGYAQVFVFDDSLPATNPEHRKVIYANYLKNIVEPWAPEDGLRIWN